MQSSSYQRLSLGHRALLALAGLSLILSVTPILEGQVDARPQKRQVKKVARRTINGITFAIPKYFNVVPAPSNQSDSLTFHHVGFDCGLFIIVPKDLLLKEGGIAQAKGFAISVLKPAGATTFEWKVIGGDKQASKYEMDHNKLIGFNGDVLITLQYRVIRVANKELMLGYFFSYPALEPGENAELFAKGLAGDSVPAGQASAEMLGSITGETIPDTYTPGGLRRTSK